MYHGEGPKNVEAIFMAAERENALLFIDEADSLLSKRLTNVNQGSEQAINSMRSQLLICLERFRGVVIFSTNLVQNYDKAFETRVRHVNFPMPDEICRKKIWEKHLPDKMPKAKDVLVEELAKVDDVCGRDIKNAVIDAAMRAARKGKTLIELTDLLRAIKGIKKSRINIYSDDSSEELTPQEKNLIGEKIKAAIEIEKEERIEKNET
jgi:SpoVK/Ycf46/Vps4 family AAA+-type ATPase